MKVHLSHLSIQQKIAGLLILYFVIACTAIFSTLFVSWRLEGGAAAINDAGKERMRSYQMGFLLLRYHNEGERQLTDRVEKVVREFEHTLTELQHGDPSRPLFLPNKPAIRQTLSLIQQAWKHDKKPLIEQILAEPDSVRRKALIQRFNQGIRAFVSHINDLVFQIEAKQTQATHLLRSFQIGLALSALVGTLILLFLFTRMVIRPIKELRAGLREMGERNFSQRLPVHAQDEFGELAAGFNQMAQQLQQSYATLEQRVRAKTRSIELKSRELKALYDIAAFLNQETISETLCDGVLGRMVTLFQAQGGVIRLISPKEDGMPIVASYGVSEDFLIEEAKLKCGECLCGESIHEQAGISCQISAHKGDDSMAFHCYQEGFASVVSIPIKNRSKNIGVLNLFFRQSRRLPAQELRLLDMICQHLGAALENQQLVAREKEMAISEERNLLAQELHDSIAQSLAFLNIQVQLLQDGLRKGKQEHVVATMELIKEGIQESYDDVRELLVHFRTRIDHDDIDVAIRSALEKFEGQTGIKTHYISDGNTVAMQPETILQVLHILHESLSNIRKHAKATQVEVQLHLGSACILTIRDNGKGFDLQHDTGETHVGLRIMKERAHRVGAQLDIDSAPGQGTTVTLILKP